MAVIFIDSLLLSCCSLTMEPSGRQGEGLVQTHKRLMVLPEVTEHKSAETLKEQSSRHEERRAAVGELSHQLC